jgi:uncharacterized protein
MHDNPAVLVFLRAPIRGRVKSRLAADVGEEAAFNLYQCFILDTIDVVEKSGYPFFIHYDPPEHEQLLVEWLGSRNQYTAQNGDNLGSRMRHAFSKVFTDGFKRAILIGSDLPDIPPHIIREAGQALNNCDAVLGPTADGGYYLIGFNAGKFTSHAFEKIQWGANTVYQETMHILEQQRIRVHVLPEWRDVDNAADLRSLFHRNRGTSFLQSKTMQYLLKTQSALGDTEKDID